MRLIDADAFLKSEIERCHCVPLIGSCTMDNESFKDILAQQPTIEAGYMIRKRRKLAVHQCQLFNCKDSEQEWQCCNYCSQEGSCEDRCLNDSKRCELLWKGDYKWWLKSAR